MRSWRLMRAESFRMIGCGCDEVGGEDQAAQVAVAKACGGEFATGRRPESGRCRGDLRICRAQHATVEVGNGMGDLVEDRKQGACVLHGGEYLEVGVVGALGELSATVGDRRCPCARGRQARAHCGLDLAAGERTLKSAILAMVVWIRRTVPALS